MKNDPIRPPMKFSSRRGLEKALASYGATFNKESSAAFNGRAFVYNGTPGWIKVEAVSPTDYVLSVYSICPCHKQK